MMLVKFFREQDRYGLDNIYFILLVLQELFGTYEDRITIPTLKTRHLMTAVLSKLALAPLSQKYSSMRGELFLYSYMQELNLLAS